MKEAPYDIFGNMALSGMLKTSKSNTWFGFTVSIGYIIIILLFFIYELVQLGEKLNPTTSMIEMNVFDPPLTDLAENHFIFGWGITQKVQNIETLYSPDYFNLEANLVEYDFSFTNGVHNLNRVESPIPIRRCKLSDFREVGEQFAQLFNVSLFTCFDYENSNGKLRLQGKFGTYKLKVIEIIYSPCKSNCAADVNVEMAFANLAFLTAGSAVDPTNFNNPIEFSRKVELETVNLNLSKLIDISIEKRTISTDTNLVSQTFEHSSDYYIKNMRTTVSTTPFFVDEFAIIRLQLADSSTVVKRTYKKIPNILADVNGMAVTITAILWTIISPYIAVKLYEKMRPQSKEDPLTFREFIRGFFGDRAAKAKYKAVKDSVDENVDLFNIIKVVAEHDKLTSLLLDPDQKMLIGNFVPTRKELHQTETKCGEGITYEPLKINQQIEDAYFRIKTKLNKSYLDLRIIELYAGYIKDEKLEENTPESDTSRKLSASIINLYSEHTPSENK